MYKFGRDRAGSSSVIYENCYFRTGRNPSIYGGTGLIKSCERFSKKFNQFSKTSPLASNKSAAREIRRF